MLPYLPLHHVADIDSRWPACWRSRNSAKACCSLYSAAGNAGRAGACTPSGSGLPRSFSVRAIAVLPYPCANKVKTSPYNRGRLLVDNQMPLSVPGSFLIAVKGKCADVKPVLRAGSSGSAADVIRHILQIPFVDKPVDLPGFFVAPGRGVGIVHNADKPDPPQREQAVNVLLNQLQFACKPRLRLAQDNVKLSLLRRRPSSRLNSGRLPDRRPCSRHRCKCL